MVGQIGNDRFDIFIGDGRIPGGDHAPHQVIPIASISAGPLGDVFPEAIGVVTGGAVQGDQRLTLVVGQKRIELVIGIGGNNIALTGRAYGRRSEILCQVSDDGLNIVAGNRRIENPHHLVHQGPPKGLIAPLAVDDHLTDTLGTVAASAVVGYQLLTLPIGKERIQRLIVILSPQSRNDA